MGKEDHGAERAGNGSAEPGADGARAVRHSRPRKAPDHVGKETEMEEKDTQNTEEDPVPLTDEEFAEFQKKERRKAGIIGLIIDIILDFFR